MGSVGWGQYLNVYFIEWKVLYFYLDFIQLCSRGPIYIKFCIASINDPMPNWQTIILTDDSAVCWSAYTELGEIRELS